MFENSKPLSTKNKVISGPDSCIALIENSNWVVQTNSCVTSSLTINSGESLTVSSNIRLVNSEGTFRNSGTINVLGTIENWGTFENFGIINVSGYIGVNDNSILINKGTIMINNEAFIVVSDSAVIDNFGIITNNDELINYGIINNHCDAVMSGNPVGMTDFGIGKIPIKQIPCEMIPEKVVEPEVIVAPTTPSEVWPDALIKSEDTRTIGVRTDDGSVEKVLVNISTNKKIYHVGDDLEWKVRIQGPWQSGYSFTIVDENGNQYNDFFNDKIVSTDGSGTSVVDIYLTGSSFNVDYNSGSNTVLIENFWTEDMLEGEYNLGFFLDLSTIWVDRYVDFEKTL